jgi:hypothetical protein
LQAPFLFGQGAAEAVVVPLPAGGLEAGLLVGTSCLAQDVGGSQEQVVVPGLPVEGDALLNDCSALIPERKPGVNLLEECLT